MIVHDFSFSDQLRDCEDSHRQEKIRRLRVGCPLYISYDPILDTYRVFTRGEACIGELSRFLGNILRRQAPDREIVGQLIGFRTANGDLYPQIGFDIADDDNRTD
jgi:hypothetical protein